MRPKRVVNIPLKIHDEIVEVAARRALQEDLHEPSTYRLPGKRNGLNYDSRFQDDDQHFGWWLATLAVCLALPLTVWGLDGSRKAG
ncbi:unnamed protein product, partial [Mesorhabditis spiculigera]